MDRVHDYESCDIGSIPIMSVFARIVQWREHGSSKAIMGAYFWRGGRDGLSHQS